MKKYNIAFNVLGLKKNTGGTESCVYGIIKSVLDNDPENNYFIFAGKSTAYVFDSLKSYKNLKIIVYPINTNNSTIRVITEHTLLALGIIRHRIDLIHHMIQYMPRFCPTKSVTTLLDLSGFFFYENLPHTAVMTRYYRHLKSNVKYTIAHTKKMIVISDFTRSEVHKYYKDVDDDFMVTIGMWCDARKKDEECNENVLNEKDIKKPYILGVSIIRPHKNFPFLIRAFNRLKEKYNIPHQLVICGGMGLEMAGMETNEFLDEIEKSPYKNDIKYLGYTKNEDLTALFKNADMYVTASMYEGFGIPLLEAMRYNLPIASSNAGSLPEVGGKGALYFDPYNVEDATEQIYKLISDDKLKEEIKSHQQERLEYYSWENVGKKVIEVYKSVLEK